MKKYMAGFDSISVMAIEPTISIGDEPAPSVEILSWDDSAPSATPIVGRGGKRLGRNYRRNNDTVDVVLAVDQETEAWKSMKTAAKEQDSVQIEVEGLVRDGTRALSKGEYRRVRGKVSHDGRDGDRHRFRLDGQIEDFL